MGLVTDPTPRSQQTYGKFKPKSDLTTHGVAWAAVEGSQDARFPSFNEITTLGQDVGGQGRHRLVYEEAKFNGKPHDIKVGGMTLREVRVPIDDLRAAQKAEAGESNEMLEQFHRRSDVQRTGIGTGLKIEELKAVTEPTEKHLPSTENTPVT